MKRYGKFVFKHETKKTFFRSKNKRKQKKDGVKGEKGKRGKAKKGAKSAAMVESDEVTNIITILH